MFLLILSEKNFIFLLNINNKHIFNFLFLKNFNFLYYFIHNYYNNTLHKNSFNYNFLKKRSLDYFDKYGFYKNNKFITNKLNNVFVTLYKHSIYKNLIRKKNINYIFLNLTNAGLYNQKFINFFYEYCFNKKNFLMLNDDYSIIYPLYKQLYNNNSLYLYKNFFFLNPINFTFKN